MIFSYATASLATFGILAQCLELESCNPGNTTRQPGTVPPTVVEENIQESSFDPLRDTLTRALPAEVKLEVPFTSQAPYQDWSAPYDEACEEASLAMVEFFLQGRTFTPDVASTEIKYLVALEDRFGWGVDISTQQVAQLASQTYRRQYHRYTGSDITVLNIRKLLAAGYPVILPVAGRELNNPNFQGSGPPYHMIVLTGYNRDNFYAHDPGTQQGEHYQYNQQLLYNAIHEWTGDRATILEGQKAMLVLEKPINSTTDFRF